MPNDPEKRGTSIAGLDAGGLMELGLDEASPLERNAGEQDSSRFTLPPADSLAAHFPDLEILEPIGAGGMGCVYKARQKRLDRIVALKILPSELSGDASFAERFKREAKMLAKLNHPNIVTVHDFGQSGDFSYLVMEYVDGMNLRELLHAGGMEPDEALAVISKLASALDYAHGENVVHRDIKPENILFDRQGHVKIADFGLAKLAFRSEVDLSLTHTRQALGTPHYMAPEQWESPKSVDHRADIYALGVVGYEMLTGRLPIGRFDPPSECSKTPRRVDDVIHKALHRDPDRRYQRAGKIREDLKAAKTGPSLAFAKNVLQPGEGGPAPLRAAADWWERNEVGSHVSSALHSANGFVRGIIRGLFRRIVALLKALPVGTAAAFILILVLCNEYWIDGRQQYVRWTTVGAFPLQSGEESGPHGGQVADFAPYGDFRVEVIVNQQGSGYPLSVYLLDPTEDRASTVVPRKIQVKLERRDHELVRTSDETGEPRYVLDGSHYRYIRDRQTVDWEVAVQIGDEREEPQRPRRPGPSVPPQNKTDFTIQSPTDRLYKVERLYGRGDVVRGMVTSVLQLKVEAADARYEHRGHDAFRTQTSYAGIAVDNAWVLGIAGLILFFAVFRWKLTVRADLMTLALAALGVVHVWLFYRTPVELVTRYDVHSVEFGLVPLAVGITFGILFLGGLWNLAHDAVAGMETAAPNAQGAFRSFCRSLLGVGPHRRNDQRTDGE